MASFELAISVAAYKAIMRPEPLDAALQVVLHEIAAMNEKTVAALAIELAAEVEAQNLNVVDEINLHGGLDPAMRMALADEAAQSIDEWSDAWNGWTRSGMHPFKKGQRSMDAFLATKFTPMRDAARAAIARRAARIVEADGAEEILTKPAASGATAW